MQFIYNFDINGADEGDDEIKNQNAYIAGDEVLDKSQLGHLTEAILDDVEIDIVDGVPSLTILPKILNNKRNAIRISTKILKQASTKNDKYNIVENNKRLRKSFKRGRKSYVVGRSADDDDNESLSIFELDTADDLSIIPNLENNTMQDLNILVEI